MKNTVRNHNIVFLGTSLPRECGIATFTQDLLDELIHLPGFNPPRIIAINNNETYAYDQQVIRQIDQHNYADYIDTADFLNNSDTDLLVIQHEFGIYGGESGEYLLPFVERLNIPYVVVFHTVLTKPSPKQHQIIRCLAERSVQVVTMAESTLTDLSTIYEIPVSKITFIHHGVPQVSTASRTSLKAQYGYPDRKILSTFGFLSPGKGIEYSIEAMRGVVKRHPEALYIVWGKTHPVVKLESGEVYRQKLTDLVEMFDLQDNVQFVDKLLTQEEVIESLVMSDIYVTPYLGKDQAVSGTLAYGVGYGRVIVSTPYRYAQEMLAEGRGLLADFHDSASLEACILRLLNSPALVQTMEDRTLKLGLTMRWNEIAKIYAALFHSHIQSSASADRSVI
ncbi:MULTISPECIES: glycosyltransferase family 4 protein [Paenibacillus]|jgi:glycosyltransferase involved in cell wall biosynthesis|uniref:Glycosyl transferase family 1 n=1 Tax=Paenibacillus odorifer TaxID=189426 RepID=A0A1R0X607_9BACL|nr:MULTISPECIES: glycosyltransferase family 4 protein [Paenibacillus]AIQ72067.1 glycosyl transferase family 1 [Paenibacillus odorifer]ETT47210.1 glycosyltransferase [Paenibacillus sp. FSL H8-237]MDH6429459.1 glycosyltransferase involved in cell wall biosynthesis [Paenibacillus sp. PastH-4]MDH6445667.1 glycosyltransferase involved in cell wall biosynthesis [Paenibacillus sp. PastF-4]MDH6529554.1 glycosyltransferase involved in cell wall biosynthesis [Paenibacillus sp. PastH-3]